MPIKFACEHCGARLSVSSRKAGARAKCPKCQQMLTVPVPPGTKTDKPVPAAETPAEAGALPKAAAEPADAAVESPSRSSPAPQTPDDPLAEFLVYDSEAELVYAADDEASSSLAGFQASLDPNKIAVSRRILYMQGALLGLVALMSLLVGILLGRGCSPDAEREDAEPQACVISGVVAVEDATGQTKPDDGATMLVVPRDMHPEQKVEIVGLRPQDPPPDENHAGLQAIHRLGGDCVRTGPEGRFQLRVPDRGSYFLLVISAHVSQDEKELAKSTLAQIGRFFRLTPKMFEGHAVRWQEEEVRRDRQLNIVFAAAQP